MATLTTRAGKGSALTHNELDANFKRTVSQKTTTYSIVEDDNRSVIECNSATPFTVTLGAAATMAAADTGDFEVTITNIGTGAVTVARSGSDTINGASTSKVLQQYDSITLKVNSAASGYVSVARAYSKEMSTVTGYTWGMYEAILDSGALPTAFDIEASVAVNTWESVGPTGSGATNIWTALNDVPSGAKWVEIKFDTFCYNGAQDGSLYVHARKTGSSEIPDMGNCVSGVRAIAVGASGVSSQSVSAHRIPIDSSGRFDLYWRGTYDGFVSTLNCYLVGFGV